MAINAVKTVGPDTRSDVALGATWRKETTFEDGHQNKLRVVAQRRKKDGRFEVIGFHRLAKSLKQSRSSRQVFDAQDEAEKTHTAFERKVAKLGWTLTTRDTKTTWTLDAIPAPQD